MQDLSALLRRISDSGLDFVIVGGFAAVTHGSSYVTRDVNLCLVLSPPPKWTSPLRLRAGRPRKSPEEKRRTNADRQRCFRARRGLEMELLRSALTQLR